MSSQESANFSTADLPDVGLLPKIRYYWTFVVAALCFIIIGIPVILIGYVLRGVFNYKEFIYPFGKFGARCYVRAAGARVHVKGYEQLDPNQAYVFVANHQSNLDPPLLIANIPRNTAWLAKKEVFKIPIMGQGIRQVHAIPVDRTNREAAIASTKLGAEVLHTGRSVVAFPEGTRSVDGKLKEFKKGVFYMALEAGVPIVPMVVNDTRLVMRRGTKYCLPNDVYVEFLPPIGTAEFTLKNIDELIAKVRDEFVSRVRTD